MEAPISKYDRKTGENRKKRRKKRSGVATPMSPSGTVTPRVDLDGQHPSTSATDGPSVKGFEGEDFIAFTFSDPSDDDEDTSLHVDAKGKGRGRDSEGGPAAPKYDGDERDRVRNRRRDGQNGRRSRPDSPPLHVREWDKGKRNRDLQSDQRQQFHSHSSKQAPWVAEIDWGSCKNVAEMLHREVRAFMQWISPSPVEDEIRGLIVTQISNAIRGSFPDARILPFGSYETKLYLPLGDIDLVVLSDSMAWSNKVDVLHALADALKRSGVTSRVRIIAKAKVPIVKFVTSFGWFNVDISVNQANGLLSGKIINGFLDNMHPRGSNETSTSIALRSLIMIVKAFLAQRSMNEVYTGGLGSYSIVCLAVSFLQMHTKIRSGEIDPEQNLGVLVMEFFELYGCYFNYDEVGISLRDGGTYFSKRQRGWSDYTKVGLLSIEDPADPSNDISRGSYGFQKVRTAFAGAYSILTATAYTRAGILHSRRNATSVYLRDRYEAEDLSILSTVMGITQETINHRRLVQELYDQRTLHNALGIKPMPIVVQATRGSSKTEIKIEGSSIHSMWKDADSGDTTPQAQRDDDDIEDGRYGISPRKRQRMGKPDYHTVFVTDDDEEGELYESGEEGDQPVKRRRTRTPGSAERKREFWLSKGTGRDDSE